MLIQKILQRCRPLANRRFFNHSSKCLESKTPDSTAKASSTVNESIMGPRMRILSNFDRFILVWTKKYPKGQVPDRVSEEVVYQAKSRARIKVANYMMLFTALMCLMAVYLGKQARDRGDTLQKRNLDWHKKINEEHQAKLKGEATGEA